MIKVYVFLITAIVALGGLITYLLLIPKPTTLSVATFEISQKPAGQNKFSIGNTNILAVGDVMLGRSVMAVSLGKNDPNYPFEKVSDELKSADITIGNLETPVIKNCPTINEGFKFCADPKMIEGLVNSGFDILNIANNHTKNYGEDGFSETENYLRIAGIDYVGNMNLVIKKIGGINFGFLGFNFVDRMPSSQEYQLISDSKKKSDVLIVMVHWGNEYTNTPNQIQKDIAEKIVESGADVIIGGHPHWVQKMDYTGGKPVFYSLGNFIFDQFFSEETKTGLTVYLNYSGKFLEQIEERSIYMSSFAQPEWR